MLDFDFDFEAAGQPDPEWDTSVPDWEERILKGLSLIPDLPLYDAVAEKALRIFKRLRIPDLPGTPTFGEVCDDSNELQLMEGRNAPLSPLLSATADRLFGSR